MYLFKLKNVSNIFSQLQTLKTKASGDRPDPRIVVSPRTLCHYGVCNSPVFQGAFLDTAIHPDSVDDRKGAVSSKFLSPPYTDIQLDTCLVCCRVDTSVTASSLLPRCDGHVKLCHRNVVQHYSSCTSWPLLLYAHPPTLEFSLLQLCLDPSTLSVKQMVAATAFSSQIWDALVSHMRGVSRLSGAQMNLLCQTQV